MTITELVSKFARRMNKQLLKTSGAGVLSSRKKTPINLREVASTHITSPRPPTPLCVRGLTLVNFLITGNQLSSVVKWERIKHKRKRLMDNMWTSWETHHSRGKACSVNNSLREWVDSSVQHMWPMLQVIGSWFANITKNLN